MDVGSYSMYMPLYVRTQKPVGWYQKQKTTVKSAIIYLSAK